MTGGVTTLPWGQTRLLRRLLQLIRFRPNEVAIAVSLILGLATRLGALLTL